jgi:hypothetical protein
MILFKSLRFQSGREQISDLQLNLDLQAKKERACLAPLDQGFNRGAAINDCKSNTSQKRQT